MTIGPIHWGSYPGDLLERVMAVFLFQERPTAWRRTASQGDAGIDVAEPIADGYRIFQIKGFTGRMSGNRPRQVKESLERAIKEPRLDGPIARWNLVVPIDPTSEEEKWFRELTSHAPFPCQWLGQVFWDSEAAKYPYVIDHYLQDGKARLMQRVKTLAQLLGEPDTPPRPADVVPTLGRLQTELNESDPHFRYEFSITGEMPTPRERPLLVMTKIAEIDSGGFVTVDVFARYVQALEDSPVGGTFTIVIPDDEEEGNLSQAFQGFLDYGRELTLPEGGLQNLTLDAPGGLGEQIERAAGTIGPSLVASFPPHRERLTLLAPDTSVVAEALVEMERATGGAKGLEVHGRELDGAFAVTLRLKISTSGDEPAMSCTFHHVDHTGMPAIRVLPGVQFLDGVRFPHRLLWRLEYGNIVIGETELPERPDSPVSAEYLRLLEAIAGLQEHTPIPLVLPPVIPVTEQRSLLRAYRLTQGETLSAPWDAGQVALPHENAERAREILLAGEALGVEKPLTAMLGGNEFFVGRIVQTIKGAQLQDSEEQGDLTVLRIAATDQGVVEEDLAS